MAGRLDGKIALVTGAARGIGEATARAFAIEGARVVISDVLDDAGARLADEIGERASWVHLDVREEAGWADAVARIQSELGGLDILVNNAGVGLGPAALQDRDLADHRQLLDVNLEGVYLGMRAVVEPMTARGGGSIVNISSIDGIVGVAGLTSYVASKFAVRGMTKSAALEMGRRGIRVNSIHPGLIDTPMMGAAPDELGAELQAMLDAQPIPRLGRPEEVASLALYLASDESSYCTGAEFVIDGGHLAGAQRWEV